jgi:hypothetical protein
MLVRQDLGQDQDTHEEGRGREKGGAGGPFLKLTTREDRNDEMNVTVQSGRMNWLRSQA